MPSDPLKNVIFRELSRLRRACVEGGGCDAESMTMQRVDRMLTKIPEHTWGEDTTWFVAVRGLARGVRHAWTPCHLSVDALLSIPAPPASLAPPAT